MSCRSDSVSSADGKKLDIFDRKTDYLQNLAPDSEVNDDSLNPTALRHYEQERQILLRT
jgi:hypothetical protein